ncbi:MAG: sugar-transfer associated ATP-grasp domain-containing protein, partial [Sedimentisphaerales bacterium]|nr:sugar-transfer associated ATP-grasp domain-containing protein [Sedimentisphaerales bacterium]
MSKRIKNIRKNLRIFFVAPVSQTYYPESPQKSVLEIWLDQLKWYAKFHTFNKYYYLYGLDRKGVSQSDYLPFMHFYKIRDQINAVGRIGDYTANYICLLRDKFIFGKYLESLSLPTPKILALCDKRSIRWSDTGDIEPLENLARRGDFDCFLKQLLSEMAECVYPLAVRQGKLYLDHKETTVETVRRAIPNKSIIQQRIIQHEKMNLLYPHAINTVRVVTAFDTNNRVIPLSAIVRIGSGGRFCDNWGFGGIAVGVDVQTGKLADYGMFRPDFGKRADHHPDTGAVFGDFVLPYFKETIALAAAVHQYFYGVHSIGWDFAITPTGPTCLEGNDDWGLP